MRGGLSYLLCYLFSCGDNLVRLVGVIHSRYDGVLSLALGLLLAIGCGPYLVQYLGWGFKFEPLTILVALVLDRKLIKCFT